LVKDLEVNAEVAPFFGVDTQEVVALRALAAMVVEYLEGNVGKVHLEESVYQLGLVCIKRLEN
jgi:hypothetical protein